MATRVRVMLMVLGLFVTGLSGCAVDESPARAAATRFADAVDAGDWRAACALLAKPTRDDLVRSAGKPCPAALAGDPPGSPGPVRDVRVYGSMAQVRSSQDTWFLTEYPEGWRVLAAECAPAPGHPYDCRLQGG